MQGPWQVVSSLLKLPWLEPFLEAVTEDKRIAGGRRSRKTKPKTCATLHGPSTGNNHHASRMKQFTRHPWMSTPAFRQPQSDDDD